MTLFKRQQNKQKTTWNCRSKEQSAKVQPKSGRQWPSALEWLTRWQVLGLIVLGLTFLSACSTAPLMPPTVPRQVPEACLQVCPALPRPADGKDLTLRLWEYEVVDLYGSCRRAQADCREWIVKYH